MPIWRSPVFSDIRNALEDQVVFSMWKGRPYFRTHVFPAQPRTPPQLAERAQWRLAVSYWHERIITEPQRAEWSRIALARLISGFNQFMSQNRMSCISSPATATAGFSMTITYTLGIGAADAALYEENVVTGALTIIAPAGTLMAGVNQTFTHTAPVAGTYRYWIADSRVLVDGEVAPQPYQCFCNERPDHVAGTAPRAETVVA